MIRFYSSNVIFAMNEAYNYYKNIKMHVMRCTTIKFKQKYGHKTPGSYTSWNPSPVLASGYGCCLHLCVHPCVNELVCAITHHSFKLGSPNLDQRCKRPWLISLLFCGAIDLDLHCQILLKNQNLPHFGLVHAITHHQLQLGFPNLDQKCILAHC